MSINTSSTSGEGILSVDDKIEHLLERRQKLKNKRSLQLATLPPRILNPIPLGIHTEMLEDRFSHLPTEVIQRIALETVLLSWNYADLRRLGHPELPKRLQPLLVAPLSKWVKAVANWPHTALVEWLELVCESAPGGVSYP